MSRPKARALASLALACALSSCSLVSLESLVIATEPANESQIAAPEGPILVRFSAEPEHRDAERAFKLNSAAGASSGDFRWSGSELSFYPVPPLKKGYRWTLSLSGSIKTLDGRSFDVDEAASFYAGSSASLLTLDSFRPAPGATASTIEKIALTFSRAVDQSAFKRNFSLSPSTDYEVSWSTEGMTASIEPKTRWTALSTYAWQVKAELVDSDGVGLARAYDGTFVVQAEGTAPVVTSVRPALYSNGTLSPVDADLGQLGYLDAIYIGFSEEVTLESVADAISLTPKVKGRVLQAGPADFAFLPEESFAARTKYRLSVLASVFDLAGNAMSQGYDAWFSPSVADIEVVGAYINGSAAVADFGDARGHGFIPSVSDGSAYIALEFNVPIAEAGQRDRLVSLASCESLFPSSLSPSLKSVQWASDSRLELTYAGFAASTAAKTYYYKFPRRARLPRPTITSS
jgi:hypothetical protein